MRRSIGCLLAAFAAALGGGARGAELAPGDLLVTDLNNGRVLHVRAATGAVETLTPLGVGPDLLQSPAGIAMGFASQAIYVVDFADGDVLRVDPATGEQSLLTRFVTAFPPHFEPIDAGPEAWGIAVRQQGWVGRFGEELYVVGPNAIHHATQDFFGEWHQTLESGDPALPDQPRQITLSEVPAEVYRMAIAGGSAGYVEYAFPGVVDGSSLVLARERVLGVHQLPSKVDTAAVQFDVENVFSCANAVVVRPNGSGGAIWSEGGLLRCPVSVEIGFHGEVYVGDVESVVGGDARILVLTPDGAGGFQQRVLAELPDADDAYPADLELVRGRAEARLLGDAPVGGTAVSPTGVSADGALVVGWASGGGFLFRAGAVEDLGAFFPEAVSADGSTVVGNEAGVGARMRLDGTYEPLALAPVTSECAATSVSADGGVVAGACRDIPSDRNVATRWATPNTPARAGDLPGGVHSSYFSSLSGSGAIGCGDGSTAAGDGAFRWTSSGLQALPALPGDDRTRAAAVSLDGSTIVGTSSGPNGTQAVRWIPPGAALPIGEPASEFFGSVAVGVSSSGGVIAGNTSGDFANGPFLWTPRHGLRWLGVELADVYGLPDPGFAIRDVVDLSADGRAIVGHTAGDAPVAYRVLLQAPEPGDAAGVLAALAVLTGLAARGATRPR